MSIHLPPGGSLLQWIPPPPVRTQLVSVQSIHVLLQPTNLVGFTDDEYKAGPLAEYERRVAAGELKPGDHFQVVSDGTILSFL